MSLTRHACSEGNKCDCIHRVFEVNKATKMTGNVSYDGGVEADEKDTGYKGWVTSQNSCK